MLGATPSPFLGPADRDAAEGGRGDGTRGHLPSANGGRVLRRAGQDGARSLLRRGGPAPAPAAPCAAAAWWAAGTGPRTPSTATTSTWPRRVARSSSRSPPSRRSKPSTAIPPAATPVTTRRTGGLRARDRRVWRARQVVLSAGVLGTVPLLLRARERGWLPALSPRLGEEVRTNSEALVGAIARRPDVDQSRGIAITSGLLAGGQHPRRDRALRRRPGRHGPPGHLAGSRRRRALAPAPALAGPGAGRIRSTSCARSGPGAGPRRRPSCW